MPSDLGVAHVLLEKRLIFWSIFHFQDGLSAIGFRELRQSPSLYVKAPS
jgi:hypothetical protein